MVQEEDGYHNDEDERGYDLILTIMFQCWIRLDGLLRIEAGISVCRLYWPIAADVSTNITRCLVTSVITE